MPDVSVLDVLLHGRSIGTLTLLSGEQTIFAFNKDYIDDPARSTLSLSFKDELGGLITDIHPVRVRVPTFFANLLPEGPMRDYLARSAGVNALREFFLLWVLGRDLPGGLVIRPADGEAWPPGEEAANAREKVRRARAMRFSLAGVQLKFSAVMEATGGLTVPVQGVGGSWIVKLPSARFDGVPENEFAMMNLARAVGINVPELRLVATGDIEGLPEGIGDLRGDALAVRRFDRLEDGGAVHIEDFAQVFGVYPEDKYRKANYRNIAEVLWAESGEEGIREFIRRLVFNALIGNGDMHLKNWSLIYPDRRTAALAPAYDFVSTIAYMPDESMALNFLRSKQFSDFSLDSLSRFAAKARLPGKLVTDSAKVTVSKFLDIWHGDRANLDVPKKVVAAINKHLRGVPLTEEAGG